MAKSPAPPLGFVDIYIAIACSADALLFVPSLPFLNKAWSLVQYGFLLSFRGFDLAYHEYPQSQFLRTLSDAALFVLGFSSTLGAGYLVLGPIEILRPRLRLLLLLVLCCAIILWRVCRNHIVALPPEHTENQSLQDWEAGPHSGLAFLDFNGSDISFEPTDSFCSPTLTRQLKTPPSNGTLPRAASFLEEAQMRGQPTLTCAICFESITPGRQSSLLRIIPGCGHVYHTSCVDPWIAARPDAKCPCCMGAIKKR